MSEWKGFLSGVNLGGWYSQCNHTQERYDTFIEKKDLETISQWGMDHVRLPIDYNLVETEDGTYIQEGFDRIQKVIEWCEEYNLNMVLDLHKTFGYSFDKGEQESGFFDREDYQERFYRLWEELATRFGKYTDRVAFELLNEVTDQDYKDRWNRISSTCIERIRKITKDTFILVGGYWNNSVDAVPDLEMPADDHIIYNFHCYEPIIFTHQGAQWVDNMPADYRISMKNTLKEMLTDAKNIIGFDEIDHTSEVDLAKHIDASYFERRFIPALKTAKERNVKLYCGEYGVIDLADPADTLEWYQYINEVFAKYEIGHSLWSYRRMNFGLADEHYDSVRAGILAANNQLSK